MQGPCTAILAATLGLIAPAAPAQPFADEAPLPMLGKIGPQLNLNTSQQQQWDAVMAQGKAARAAAGANFTQVLATLRAELAKPEPDLAAVAALSDSVHQQNSALHQQARNAWLALYATFTSEQKGVVRDAIIAGLDRSKAWRSSHPDSPPSSP